MLRVVIITIVFIVTSSPYRRAFAYSDGDRVLCWGEAQCGGDAYEVLELQDQLKDLQQLQSTNYAFAGLADGRVVTWGRPDQGGDCEDVAEQLTDVQEIQSTRGAFVAIRADGKAIAWGHATWVFERALCSFLLRCIFFDVFLFFKDLVS